MNSDETPRKNKNNLSNQLRGFSWRDAKALVFSSPSPLTDPSD